MSATFLWSFGGILVKWVVWHPLAIAGMRSAISAVFLLFFLRKPSFTFSFAQIGGAVSFAATVILFVSATKLTTAANAVILQYTAPVYTAIIGGYLGNILAVISGIVTAWLTLFLRKQKDSSPLDAILVCSMEPVLNPVWVFLFLKEAPGKWAILGGGVIIVAITFRSLFSRHLQIS
jgi:drug/metabolite transporter (DMT)-like permease